MKYDHTELAWAAGLYDGEGCTTNRGNMQPSMTISQTDPFVLERFAAAVGVGTVHGPYHRKRQPTHKPHWNYQSGTFENTQQCLAVIWKWLSPQKRTQAIKRFTEYRERLKTRPEWRNGAGRCKRNHDLTLPGAIMTHKHPDRISNRCVECQKLERLRAKKVAA